MLPEPARNKPVAISPTLPLRVAEALARAPGDDPIVVGGWVRTRRASKAVGFVAVSDGSCLHPLQLVVPLDGPEAEARRELLAQIQTGAAVRASGTLVASPGGEQAVELRVSQLALVGEADAASYPLQKKGHSLEFLRSLPHLRGRSNTFGAVFRLRSLLAQTTHAFFAQHGFHCVHTPIITTSDCEGAGEMFDVSSKTRADLPFFGRPAFLTVSGQLAGESLAYALGRIYTFGPTFRAENSNTVRHLAEFWMVEPEMAFFTLAELMDLAEAYVTCCVQAALNTEADGLQFLQKHFEPTLLATLETIATTAAVRMTYTEAVNILTRKPHAFENPVAWGHDLSAEHERYLTEQHCHGPVFLTDYPREIKAFYMYENDDGRTVAAMDLLVPRLGELIGGSQREHRLGRLSQRLRDNLLKRKIADVDASMAEYAWYLDQNRYGAVPHAGFGLGFERLVMLVSGMANIRDVIPYPRAPDLAAG